MNIYLISQRVNNGYDTYDSAVVAAETEEQARMIYPTSERGLGLKCNAEWKLMEEEDKDYYMFEWCARKDVVVEFIGVAKEGTPVGCICSSYNAG